MGAGRDIIKGLFKAAEEAKLAKTAEPVAKEVEATRPWRNLTDAEKKAARDASRTRIGVPQRELSALRAQTIARSGESGYRGMAGEFRAQLQEAGEFPLRTSIEPKPGGGGGIRYTERDMYGKAPSAERTTEITSGIAERVRPGITKVEGFDIGKYQQGVREHVAERATERELRARSAATGRTPTGVDARSAEKSARVAVETGSSRAGFENVSGRVGPPGTTKTGLSEYEKLRRGVQSGAIKAATVGVLGGPAAEIMREYGSTYSGPDNSHRNPQVQWGRNRQ